MDENTLKHVLRQRGVDTPCDKCKGLGTYWYSSGATWRGGMGVAAVTPSVCCECWGSGDKHRHWTNIQEIETKQANWEVHQCHQWLSRRLGVGLSDINDYIQMLADLCLQQASRRKIPDNKSQFWWNSNWIALSKIFQKLVRGLPYEDEPEPETSDPSKSEHIW